MKIKHILVCGDNHGDKVNTDVAKKLFEWRDSYKWDHVIHLGDIFDFRPFRKGASDEEKGHGIRHDIKCGLDFLEKYRPTLITWGNHDWRPFQWAEDYADGLKQEYAQDIVRELKSWLAIKDIPATPYHIRDNCINVCGINFTHGFRSSAVNPAKMLWENFGNAVCAHGHKYDRYQANRHPREKAFMIPIVANIFMDYNNRTPASLGHCNGFAHIEVIEMKSGRTEWELYPILKEGKNMADRTDVEKSLMDLLEGYLPKVPPSHCFTKKDYFQACKAANSGVAERTASAEVDRRVENGEFGLWGIYKGRPYYYVKAAE